MTKHLPTIPSIRHLHTQAKDLLELCRFGDPVAIDQIRSSNIAFRSITLDQIASRVRLCDAQLAVARSYGYRSWPALITSATQIHDSTIALSNALMDPRMDEFDFRAGIARCKRLPAIGTTRVSEHGVRYDVVDYMPSVSPHSAARIRSGDSSAHINDLLPIISFPEMSDKLLELYIETDCVTTKPLIFFDTIPGMHPNTSAPGLNQVLTPVDSTQLYIHFDAAQLHETIIAHELGHIWVEKVEQIEDFRHPLDQSDLPRITQFYHIQSFVMDLRVNDLLARRGFDMSIIALHQAEAIVNFAGNVARKAPMRGVRVLAAVINTLAGAMLEMERFPGEWCAGIKDALDMIRIGLPEAFEPAKGFVRSVLHHGYADSAAVMRVVDECAMLSFAATGERFDPDKDLIETVPSEPKWDKRPDFLTCLPLDAKLEVCREAAKRGITGRAKYDVVVRYPHQANVAVTDPACADSELISLNFSLPAPPPNPHLMPGAPIPNIPIGNAYIPPPGFCPPQFRPTSHLAESGRGHSGIHVPFGAQTNPSAGVQLPPTFDPFRGLPDAVRPMNQRQAVSGAAGHSSVNGFQDPIAEARRRNEEIDRSQAEAKYRQRLLEMHMMERHCESYSGTDLKPLLTPAGEEYAKLNSRRAIAGAIPARNYMAGLGRWISQVGFAQQMAGEPAYGYANNNPVTYIDPTGDSPQNANGKQTGGTDNCQTRHQSYCSAAKSTGLGFNNCACRVSQIVCNVINDPTKTSAMRQCMDCINAGMFAHWKKRDTDPWRQASQLCSQPGTTAMACCSAMVSAEQKGLTECKTNKCSSLCSGSGRLFPPSNLPEANRIGLATNLCCSPKQQGGPGSPVTVIGCTGTSVA